MLKLESPSPPPPPSKKSPPISQQPPSNVEVLLSPPPFLKIWLVGGSARPTPPPTLRSRKWGAHYVLAQMFDQVIDEIGPIHQ